MRTYGFSTPPDSLGTEGLETSQTAPRIISVLINPAKSSERNTTYVFLPHLRLQAP